MRCIFPCLQLIYFYMDVKYIVSFACWLVCFSFVLLKVKIGDVGVALRMPC